MRKGQITMESLLLYGVAILVVLLAVAALTYFGVLDMGRMLPASCNLGGSDVVSCEEWNLKNDELKLGIRNLANRAIEIQSISFQSTGVTCSNAEVVTIQPGQIGEVECTNFVDAGGEAAALPQNTGQRVRGDIQVVWKYDGGAVDQTSAGRIAANLAP